MTSADRNDLLDHLVGAGEQMRRDGDAKRFGSGPVDDEIELGRLLDRQIRRLRPAQNSLGDAC